MQVTRVNERVIRIRGRRARGSNMGPGWPSPVKCWGDARPSGSMKKHGRAAVVKAKAARQIERKLSQSDAQQAQREEVFALLERLGIPKAVYLGTGRKAQRAKRTVRRAMDS